MLWKDDIQIIVQTNGSLNIEENLRQTLLASFNEYVDLLKQLGIPVIKIEGNDVKIHEVFSDDLTITDLKGRRAVVIKVKYSVLMKSFSMFPQNVIKNLEITNFMDRGTSGTMFS